MLFDAQDNFQRVKDGIKKLFWPPDFANEATPLFKWNWQNPDIEESLQRGTMHLEQK
jgi:hypothetical protein